MPPLAAQGSDRDKPLHYEADAGECDDMKQVCTLVGNVILVKGTMRVTGERVQIRRDPAGYQYGTITVPAGQLATFRQRRDGSKPNVEEYIEGYAQRIEYDERADTVRLQPGRGFVCSKTACSAMNCAATRLHTISATRAISWKAARHRPTRPARTGACAARSHRVHRRHQQRLPRAS
jgi:lipopolysaccharide transport protein LptA